MLVTNGNFAFPSRTVFAAGNGPIFIYHDVQRITAEIARGTSDPHLDVDGNERIDDADLLTLLYSRAAIHTGDVNLNGVVDSSDLVLLFQAGRYELDELATWLEGDFDGDGRFTSTDLIFWMQAFRDQLGDSPVRSLADPNSVSTAAAFGGIVAFAASGERTSWFSYHMTRFESRKSRFSAARLLNPH